MSEFNTPMMKQYMAIKRQYNDCLLFYRMGDFYELFLEDAYIGARILNITLTKKRGGKDGDIPMAGVPYHSVDTYIAKLVKEGYKVAICEQLSPPNKRGIVKRDVVRIITPGTLLDESALEKKENNYIVSFLFNESSIALAAADLSTGFFAVLEKDYLHFEKNLIDELSRFNPSECILPDDIYNDPDILQILKKQKGMNIFPYAEFNFFRSKATETLQTHFGISTLEGFGIDKKELALQAAAALLGYLKSTQKGNISHIKKISPFFNEDGLILDRSSIINLELFSTIREHDTKGTLLSVMDNTITAMGGRLLKQWMKKPLVDKEEIEKRLDSVELLLTNTNFRDDIREKLKQIPDIERLLSRLSVNLGNGRDMINLQQASKIILEIKKIIIEFTPHNSLLKKQADNISIELKDISERIAKILVDDPPISVKEGGLIREGVDAELDLLRNRISKSKEWIMELERKEREKTGINSLKVKFNKIFGFYIEISKANLHLVPSTYMRKQTLVNNERFITEELKEHEEIILTAEEKINELEYKIFNELLNFVLSHTNSIQKAAESIGIIDCLANFAFISEKEHYRKPKILYSGEIRIKQGRHPVVEKLIDENPFVANDIFLDNTSQSLLIITGPNMAGKSVLIRQVALIVLMAQMGCFVPAASAHIGIVDRIFVRSGASDVITNGLSTFMVEMVETANILHNATQNSLIIMDEIGRGTSTYDGISIAWAVAEYLVTAITPSPKVLFATHYHELQALENQYPNNIKNFHMAVTEQKGEPIFLHTLLPGGASHSFGVAVAKLAGVPQKVVDRAYDILQTLEYREVYEKGKQYFPQQSNILSFYEKLNRSENNIEKSQSNADLISLVKSINVTDHFLSKELLKLDIGTLTPIEALNKLAELKEKVRLLSAENDPLENVD